MKTAGVIDQVVCWLNDYCDKVGMKGFVVGVSGGIDSAVTSTLCAKTGKDVILLTMPIFQVPEQLTLAEKHITWLEQKYKSAKGFSIDLTASFQAIERALPQEIRGDGLTMANTRSRMRMVTLYAFSTHNKMLVVGTGNKVEDFGVGFFTKYGDGGVDISPIADLMKSEVYAVGKELGVSTSIINATPTDGLWDDRRTDEVQMGATYTELEWAMEFEADPKSEEGLDARQKEVLALFRGLNQKNQHKVKPIPVFKVPESLRS